MSNGILVILGSKDERNFVESMTQTVIDLIDKEVYGNIYLVGLDYRKIQVTDLPVEVVVIPDHPTRVFSLRPRIPASGTYPPFQASMHYSAYYKRMEFTKDSENKITFACFDDQIASNIFEIAAIVFTETISNRKWLIINDMNDLFSNFGTPIPDIFKGEADAIKIRDQVLTEKDRKDLKSLIIQGMDILRCELGAGYYYLENNKGVPGWAIHSGVPWNSLIIGIFNILPGSIDKTQHQEMFESSHFRKLMTDITLGILSNYITNTDIKPTIKDMKSSYDSHYSYLFGDEVPSVLKSSREKILKDTGEEHTQDIIAWTNKELWDNIRMSYATSDITVI